MLVMFVTSFAICIITHGRAVCKFRRTGPCGLGTTPLDTMSPELNRAGPLGAGGAKRPDLSAR